MTQTIALDSQTKANILQAAVLAPSADNSQPWCYEWQDNMLALYRDAKLSGHATDNTFVLTDLAVGCAIENIVITASQAGLDTRIQLFPQGESALLSAFLTFLPQLTCLNDNNTNKGSQASQLSDQIAKRCTDRRLPFKGQLSEQTLQTLIESVDSAAVKLYCYTDRAKISSLAKIIKSAEAIRFKSEALHQELFSSVSFDEEQPVQGMTAAMLGIETPARPFFRFISKWSNMKKLNALGAAAMVATRSVSLPIRLSPALAVITTSGMGREAMIDAGRQLQRFWLTATKLGIAVHPYAAPGVLTLANPPLDNVLTQELSAVKQQLQAHFSKSEQVVMFFRLGYKAGQPVRSHRRSVEQLANRNTL